MGDFKNLVPPQDTEILKCYFRSTQKFSINTAYEAFFIFIAVICFLLLRSFGIIDLVLGIGILSFFIGVTSIVFKYLRYCFTYEYYFFDLESKFLKLVSKPGYQEILSFDSITYIGVGEARTIDDFRLDGRRSVFERFLYLKSNKGMVLTISYLKQGQKWRKFLEEKGKKLAEMVGCKFHYGIWNDRISVECGNAPGGTNFKTAAENVPPKTTLLESDLTFESNSGTKISWDSIALTGFAGFNFSWISLVLWSLTREYITSAFPSTSPWVEGPWAENAMIIVALMGSFGFLMAIFALRKRDEVLNKNNWIKKYYFLDADSGMLVVSENSLRRTLTPLTNILRLEVKGGNNIFALGRRYQICAILKSGEVMELGGSDGWQESRECFKDRCEKMAKFIGCEFQADF